MRHHLLSERIPLISMVFRIWRAWRRVNYIEGGEQYGCEWPPFSTHLACRNILIPGFFSTALYFEISTQYRHFQALVATNIYIYQSECLEIILYLYVYSGELISTTMLHKKLWLLSCHIVFYRRNHGALDRPARLRVTLSHFVEGFQSKQKVKPSSNLTCQVQVWEEVGYQVWEDEDRTAPKEPYKAFQENRATHLGEKGLTGNEPLAPQNL